MIAFSACTQLEVEYTADPRSSVPNLMRLLLVL